MSKSIPTTKRERRQANLLNGSLTPSWARSSAGGSFLRQFLRQMRRR